MVRRPEIVIRPATSADIPLIVGFIHELAERENIDFPVTVTVETLQQTLFTSHNTARVLLAYADGQPAAFSFYYQSFSTFLGKPGLRIEDLYVKPEWRGLGVGSSLLQYIARQAVHENCSRLEWDERNDKIHYIQFYERIGAEAMHDWKTYRLINDRLHSFATRDITSYKKAS